MEPVDQRVLAHLRHRAQRGAGGDAPAVGDVVIVKTKDKSRGKWPLGIIENLIVGTTESLELSRT